MRFDKSNEGEKNDDGESEGNLASGALDGHQCCWRMRSGAVGRKRRETRRLYAPSLFRRSLGKTKADSEYLVLRAIVNGGATDEGSAADKKVGCVAWR